MRRAISMGVLALLIVTAGSRAAAGSSSVDLGQFLAELDRLLQALPDSSPASAAALQQTIPSSWIVSHRDQQFHVSALAIRRSLDEGLREPTAWPTRRAAVVLSLREMREEAARLNAADADVGGLERSRAVLAAVLGREEFRRTMSESAATQLRRRLTEWFIRLWERLGGRVGNARQLPVVLAWAAALVALTALSWWLVATLVRANARASALALLAPRARRWTARAWAQHAASAAEPREAVRCAYRAAVTKLEEEGTWRTDDARTPREHVRLLPPGHQHASPFTDVARRFEEVWFGARTPTADDMRRVLARLKELGCSPAE